MLKQKKFQILIVDDNPKNLQFLEEILSGEGYRVLLATNGLQALKTARGVFPDLILLDVMMPEMDGYEACKRLKEFPQTKDIPVIFLTAKTETEDLVQGFECGAVDYVNKPFNSTELLARVKTQLKLKSALENLKETQVQLVQSEKMAGLNTLVAGIAHEINNPLTFVHLGASSSEAKLQEFKDYLFSLLGEDNDPAFFQDFEEWFKEIFSMISNTNKGSQRIANLVKDLRIFARLDEAEQKTVDLVETLQATLRFIQPLYQDEIHFIEDFQVQPKVECYPALLNQAFMNLALNACQAMQIVQTEKQNPGTLTIRILSQEKNWEIRFEDTGCGMAEEVKKQVFDPFFTTKEVGEGTGLGLSITLGVINKHQGKIEVESTPGEGSTFTVLLPWN